MSEGNGAKKEVKIFEAVLTDGGLNVKIHPTSLINVVLAERMLGLHIDNLIIKADINSAAEKSVIETAKKQILIPENILKRME